LDCIRPWDLDQDLFPLEIPSMPAYGSPSDLQDGCANIFSNLDPQLAEYYRLMQHGGYLDLQNRKGKAPGGYCMGFPVTRRSFIFMNAVGRSSDVRTLLHESGHAFHNFERFKLPYMQQRTVGLEFAEVASMAMELLAYPFLSAERGGFFDGSDVLRFQVSHLEHILLFWPYMAVVDAFQHWVYTHHDLASDPARCDEKWLQLWQRFFPGVDWSGLDTQAMTGWHRKQHIFRAPLYYVEYGLAQLGAVQVWKNSIQDPSGALNRYRFALSLWNCLPSDYTWRQEPKRL
jgi:oligoendopeptidase F